MNLFWAIWCLKSFEIGSDNWFLFFCPVSDVGFPVLDTGCQNFRRSWSRSPRLQSCWTAGRQMSTWCIVQMFWYFVFDLFFFFWRKILDHYNCSEIFHYMNWSSFEKFFEIGTQFNLWHASVSSYDFDIQISSKIETVSVTDNK